MLAKLRQFGISELDPWLGSHLVQKKPDKTKDFYPSSRQALVAMTKVMLRFAQYELSYFLVLWLLQPCKWDT